MKLKIQNARLAPHHVSRKRGAGFTLVELLVVVAIFTMVTTLILARYSQFNNTILLSNLAYDMALSARQAQVYGLSVRQQTIGGSFTIPYGIYFSATSPTTYLIFADSNGNLHYDQSNDTVVQAFTLRQGYQIAELCGVLADGTERCSPGDIAFLAVLFRRPDPDAFIRGSLDPGNPGADIIFSSGIIRLRSPQGEERSVSVASTGQISVGY